MERGPRQMADKIRDEIDELNARLEVAELRRERSAINKQLHRLRELLTWCETRAGYVAGA